MGFWPVPSKRSRDLAVCGLRPDVRPAPGDVSLWVGRRRARRWRRSCGPVLTPGPPPPVAGARRRRPEPGPGRGPGRARLPGPPVRLTARRRDGGGRPPRLIAMCRPTTQRPRRTPRRRPRCLRSCRCGAARRVPGPAPTRGPRRPGGPPATTGTDSSGRVRRSPRRGYLVSPIIPSSRERRILRFPAYSSVGWVVATVIGARYSSDGGVMYTVGAAIRRDGIVRGNH